ncbi:uncharacterized protein LOC144082472 isoform X1 [Stigmatopora argus]
MRSGSSSPIVISMLMDVLHPNESLVKSRCSSSRVPQDTQTLEVTGPCPGDLPRLPLLHDVASLNSHHLWSSHQGSCPGDLPRLPLLHDVASLNSVLVVWHHLWSSHQGSCPDFGGSPSDLPCR